jgi:hypothetical protein
MTKTKIDGGSAPKRKILGAVLCGLTILVLILFCRDLSFESEEDTTPKTMAKLPETICFHSNQASERGTEVALYDYADFAELLYGFKSKILFPDTPKTKTGKGLEMFQKRFEVGLYPLQEGIHQAGGKYLLLKAYEMHCDYLYILKTGRKSDKPFYDSSYKNSKIPVGIHAVFVWEPHGSVFAAISPQVTKGVPGRAVVPHMIREIDEKKYFSSPDFRKELGIPPEALVLCRHGAKDAFDVRFVQESVWELVQKYNSSQLHFIFLNTNYFSPPPLSQLRLVGNNGNNGNNGKTSNSVNNNHSQIHHLPVIPDRDEMNRFFRSCDAMIHARVTGENFGLAPAEFSIRGLPVIGFPGSMGNEHLRILGDKAFVFHNKEELFQLIQGFVARGIPRRDYNGHRVYTPVFVMKDFVKHLLEPIYGVNAFDHMLKVNTTVIF